MSQSLLTAEMLAEFQARKTVTKLAASANSAITEREWQDRVRGNVAQVEDTDRGVHLREMGFVLEAKAEVANDDIQWRIDRHERLNGRHA